MSPKLKMHRLFISLLTVISIGCSSQSEKAIFIPNFKNIYIGDSLINTPNYNNKKLIIITYIKGIDALIFLLDRHCHQIMQIIKKYEQDCEFIFIAEDISIEQLKYIRLKYSFNYQMALDIEGIFRYHNKHLIPSGVVMVSLLFDKYHKYHSIILFNERTFQKSLNNLIKHI